MSSSTSAPRTRRSFFQRVPRTLRTNVPRVRQQRNTANRAITARAEKKHEHNSINANASIDQNGDIIKLSPIGQGQDNHDRLGAYCKATSLQMRWAMLPGSPNFVLVRMILFQYLCDDDVTPPTSADVLENTLPDSDNQLFSPYKQDNNLTRVLWDKMSWVAGESQSTQKVLTGRVMIPGKKIKKFKFNRGGQTSGSNMIYLLLVSTRLDGDAASFKPNFKAIANIRFTDT